MAPMVQVDEVTRLREAQLHHRQQAVAAGEQFGVTAEFSEQLQGLGDGLWSVIVE